MASIMFLPPLTWIYLKAAALIHYIILANGAFPLQFYERDAGVFIEQENCASYLLIFNLFTF